MLSKEEICNVAHAYFSKTTKEIVELEILLIRSDVQIALPFIVAATINSIHYKSSVRDVLKEIYHKPGIIEEAINYTMAERDIGHTIDHAFRICKRLGDDVENIFVQLLKYSEIEVRLVSGLLLLKYEKLTPSTIKMIRALVDTLPTNSATGPLFYLCVLLLYKNGDNQTDQWVKREAMLRKTDIDDYLRVIHVNILYLLLIGDLQHG